MPVELHGRSQPAHNAARMLYHTDHRPCGCQGIKELKGPSKGHGLKGLDVKGHQNSPSPRASGFAGSRVNCEVQGSRRSPLMNLVFEGYQRAIRFRVSRDRGSPLNGRGFQEV